MNVFNIKGISNVFIHCVEKLLLDKPDNPIQFIIDHLSSTYPESVMRGAPTQDESVAASLLPAKSGEQKTSLDFSDDDDDYDDSDDDISDMHSIPMARRTRRRYKLNYLFYYNNNYSEDNNNNVSSGTNLNLYSLINICFRTAISAAPLNMNTIKTEEPKFFEKSPQVAAGIRNILVKNILFQHLDEQQITTVIQSFESMDFSPGTDVITQGETGSHFFLLASGEAVVYVSKRGGEPKKVNK
jgi:cAMP-dependent protein kinase regulator